MTNFLLVFLGGGIGATCRYLSNILIAKYFGISFIATFLVNIIGCFLIGLLLGLSLRKPEIFPAHLKLFCTMGILGALTTFSTFTQEVFLFLKDGKVLHAFCYLFLSISIGLLFAFLGHSIKI